MTGSRSALGQKLREIRKRYRVSGPELARRMDYNQSGVSKIESGIIIPSRDYVSKFALALKLGKAETNELLTISDLFFHEFHRWDAERYGTSARLQELVRKREKHARDIRTFNWSIIPGLLQTEQYARAVFQVLGERGELELKKAVASRIKRQELLNDSKCKFTAVVPENALRSAILRGDCLIDQLHHLIELNQKDNIDINVLPMGTLVLCHPVNNFVIYDERTVTVEMQTMQSVIWDESDVDKYRRVFGLLISAALRKELSNKFIADLACTF